MREWCAGIGDGSATPIKEICGITISDADLRAWYAHLEARVVIGLCHNAWFSAESMKGWIQSN